jgi:hypothetical protein
MEERGIRYEEQLKLCSINNYGCLMERWPSNLSVGVGATTPHHKEMFIL